jgi:hypothetical protein
VYKYAADEDATVKITTAHCTSTGHPRASFAAPLREDARRILFVVSAAYPYPYACAETSYSKSSAAGIMSAVASTRHATPTRWTVLARNTPSCETRVGPVLFGPSAPRTKSHASFTKLQPICIETYAANAGNACAHRAAPAPEASDVPTTKGTTAAVSDFGRVAAMQAVTYRNAPR